MTILLKILKTAGKCLLWLLAAVFILLLVLLFCPVFYEIRGEKYEKARAEAEIKALFGILKLKLGYDKDGMSIVARIFGKKLKIFDDGGNDAGENEEAEEAEESEEAEEAGKKEGKRKLQKQKEVTGEGERKGAKNADNADNADKAENIKNVKNGKNAVKKTAEGPQKDVSPKACGAPELQGAEKTEDPEDPENKNVRTIPHGMSKDGPRMVSKGPDYGPDNKSGNKTDNEPDVKPGDTEKKDVNSPQWDSEEAPEKENTVRKIKFSDIKDDAGERTAGVNRKVNIKYIKMPEEKETEEKETEEKDGSVKGSSKAGEEKEDSIQNERLNLEYFKKMPSEDRKKLISAAIRLIKSLFRGIKPRNFYLKGELGLSDPALTGQIVGAVWSLGGMTGKRMEVQAVFDRQVVEGEFSAKGHIVPAFMLFYIIRFIAVKPVRKIIKLLIKGDKNGK